VVTGIFIMFEGAFNVGDIIVMDNFRGTVRSIGVRTTIFEDDGGNLKIVNNSDIRNVQNRSRNGSLAVCDVGISYDSSIPAAEKVILDCLEKMWQENDGMYLSHPVYAGVQALADSSVVLRCRVEVREEDIFAAQRRLNRAVKLALDEGGIEIPFPQVVVHQAK
jgi:small conductance mechanosensitive channel